jgi:hypothetical protein
MRFVQRRSMLAEILSSSFQATCMEAFDTRARLGNYETNVWKVPMNVDLEKKLSLLGGVIPRDPIAEEELIVIETSLGSRFPEDYREFVECYGGASFGELVEFKLLKDEPVHWVESLLGVAIPRYETAPLSHFYGSRAGNQSLAKKIKIYKGRMPDTLIPVADDGGGHQICLGISGNERGKIYYWDHYNEWDEQDYLEDYGRPVPVETKFQNVYLVAESFEKLILCLEKADGM